MTVKTSDELLEEAEALMETLERRGKPGDRIIALKTRGNSQFVEWSTEQWLNDLAAYRFARSVAKEPTP